MQISESKHDQITHQSFCLFKFSLQWFITGAWLFPFSILQNLTCSTFLCIMSSFVAPHSKWPMSCHFCYQLFINSSLVHPSCWCGPEWMIGEVTRNSSFLCHFFDCVPQFIDPHRWIHKPCLFSEDHSWSQVESRWFPVNWHSTVILVEHVYRTP